jgi:hypothetical protein
MVDVHKLGFEHSLDCCGLARRHIGPDSWQWMLRGLSVIGCVGGLRRAPGARRNQLIDSWACVWHELPARVGSTTGKMPVPRIRADLPFAQLILTRALSARMDWAQKRVVRNDPASKPRQGATQAAEVGPRVRAEH